MSATAGERTFDWPALAAAQSGAGPALDGTLGEDLLAHLDVQLISAQRMLQVVLEQASAIRRRAVRQVVVTAGELQVEMHRRELIERDRMRLMERAARQLSVAPANVGFTSILAVLDPETAELACSRTDELRRMLTQIDAEHTLNRTLMGQELAFLDHLLGLAGGTGAYGARRTRPRVFEVEA